MGRRTNHFYHVILEHKTREDVDDRWDVTETVRYTTHNREKALAFIYTHRYLESQIDDDDDASHWLDLKTLYIKQIY